MSFRRVISDHHAVCHECQRKELLDVELIERATEPDAWPECHGQPMVLPSLEDVDRINEGAS